MKKITAWLLAFLLTGFLILFSVTLLCRQVIAPAMTEEGAPVSDTVIREEQEMLRRRLDGIADIYGIPVEPAVNALDEATLRDLNTQASQWWSGVMKTGKPAGWVTWNTEELEQAMVAAAETAAPENTEDAVSLSMAGMEAIRRSVVRSVLPMRQEIIEPGLQKVRQKIDLPNLITFFLGIPGAALAICVLLSGLIALLESRYIRGCLKYIGAALGAAALVIIALGGMYLSMGIESMLQEASESMMVIYRDALSRALVPAAVLLGVMIIGSILCLALCRGRDRTA